MYILEELGISMAELRELAPALHKRILEIKLSRYPVNLSKVMSIPMTLEYASPELSQAALCGCKEDGRGRLYEPPPFQF